MYPNAYTQLHLHFTFFILFLLGRREEDQLVKSIVRSDVKGVRLKGRPRMDGVKKVLIEMNVCVTKKDDYA